MKGILLAGGTGSRLRPLTQVCNKHLLPVYDKPLVYYSLSTLMLSGVRDVLVISSPKDLSLFRELLGNGARVGISIQYAEQPDAGGIVEGILIGREFIQGGPTVLMLGDNILHGPRLGTSLSEIDCSQDATIFAYEVADARQYGVVELDDDGVPIRIVEKPVVPPSNLAIPGLYFLPPDAPEMAETLSRSRRGELEISDLNQKYLDAGRLRVVRLPRGTAWLDSGTPESLHDAATFVRVMQERQGLRIGVPEEVAWRKGWLTRQRLESAAHDQAVNSYSNYLLSILD